MERLVFDVYGLFRVHAEPLADGWRLLRVAPDGKRGLLDVVVPPGMGTAGLPEYLDDLLHELAGPGDAVRRVE